MNVQQANGTLFPGVSREEMFKLENPLVPGVIWLQDLDVGGDVAISTAPDADGLPGTYTLRVTVTLAAKAMKMQDLPAVAGEPYIKVEPLASKTEYALASPSPFHYTRHLP